MSDNAMYSIDCAMFLSEETKGPSVSTKDKRVATTFSETERISIIKKTYIVIPWDLYRSSSNHLIPHQLDETIKERQIKAKL